MELTIKDFHHLNRPLQLKGGEFKTLTEILYETDEFLEVCHNHIQWLFPTNKPSMFNKDAPMLTQDNYFYVRPNLYKMVNRMMKFFNNTDMTVMNHNHLRVTRIIECCTLCGDNILAGTFLNHAFGLYLPQDDTLNVVNYWIDALKIKGWNCL